QGKQDYLSNSHNRMTKIGGKSEKKNGFATNLF
ncbi:MAG: hypothetical protein K0Q87_5451, partial [Neobacillus sp.]|nr:hypothetical protein [Neobacillus sp.]